MEKSILSAQYNNRSITPNELADIRGSGKFSTQGTSIYNPSANNYFTKNLSDNSRPQDGLQWSVSNTAPWAPTRNDEFLYTDMSSVPPGSKESLMGDAYLQFGLQSVGETPTAVNTLFFSKPNVKYIAKRLIDDVKELTGVTIKPQSENTIMIVMINKYTYANAGSLPTTSVVHLALPRGEKECSLRDRLSRLNQAVIQELVKQVLGGISAYTQYYKDASSMPVPLSHPTLVTMKGSRVIPFGNVGLYENGQDAAKTITSFNMRNNVI